MTWQTGTTSNSEQAYYRDAVAQLVQHATSEHVATVAVNAGGTGYVEGDVLTLTHASAIHDATFEVTDVSGGVIQAGGLRIITSGSFGRRVATVAVNAAGTNYNPGDIVEIDEGHASGTDFKQRCKITIDTVSSGPPGPASTISIFEGGGNYQGGTDPSATASTTTKIGPAAGSGSGLTVNTTMQAIVGTTGLSLTGGTGSGATADITLAHTGWFTERDDHDYEFTGSGSPGPPDDEKQVVLRGTVTGGDEPLIGYVTWTDRSGATDYEGTLTVVMDQYNDGLPLESQVGANPNSDEPSTSAGAYIPSLNEAENFFLRVSGRKIAGVHRTVGTTATAYHHHYVGLMEPFGTATEAPYPMFHAGACSGTRVWEDATTAPIDSTGLAECLRNTNRNGPTYYRRADTTAYARVVNGEGTSIPASASTARVMAPIGAPALATSGNADEIVDGGDFDWFASIMRNTGVSATLRLVPTPDSTNGDQHLLLPLVVEVHQTAPEFGPQGQLEEVFWVSATKDDLSTIASEDTVTGPGGEVYRVFQSGVRAELYSFIAFPEGS